MKYANFISAAGALVIILWALLKILHLEIVNPIILLCLGLLLTFVGQEWKIKLLKEQIKKQEPQKPFGIKTDLTN